VFTALPVEPGDGSEVCVSPSRPQVFRDGGGSTAPCSDIAPVAACRDAGSTTKPVATGRNAAVTASQQSSIGHRKFLDAAGSATLALPGVA
jgi:hypothetical protein